MLKIDMNKTVSGNITLGDSDDVTVVSLNATVGHLGEGSYVSFSVVDHKLYIANKETVRKDILDFIGQIFEMEDRE